MTTKTIKTSLLTALVAISVLSMGGITGNAYAQTTEVQSDPTVTRYLQDLLADEDGIMTHEFEDYSVNTRVIETGDDTYKVKTKIFQDGKLIDKIVYKIDNSNLGEMSVDVNGETIKIQSAIEKVGGVSTQTITPGYYLTIVDIQSNSVYIGSSDSYNFSAHDGACHGADYDVFGPVYGSTGNANFTWSVDNYHWYSCIIPQFLQLGVVNFNDNSSYGKSLGSGETAGSWSGSVSIPDTYYLRGTFNYVLP